MRASQRLQQAFLLFLLIVGIASTAVGGPQTGGWGFGGNPRPESYIAAFFQAFSANGRGTSGACSTTAPTGYRGQVLTFTRASAGTCTKTASGGLATTGIANSDLVVLTNNVARVEYDSAGTLGLLVEAARTNSTIRSQEFDNAAWTKRTVNSLWANDAGAPDGTQTAEALHLNATTTPAGVDGIYSAAAACGAANPSVASLYVRGATPPDGGVAGSGTLDITIYNGVAFTCVNCAYVADSWSRCVTPSFSATSGSDFIIGNESRTALCPSAVSRPAQDVLLWQADCQNGAYTTSPIPTTSAAVTRAAEVSTVNGSAFPTTTYSVAATVQVPWTAAQMPTGAGILEGQNGSNSGVGFFFVSGSLRTQNLTAGADNNSNYTWVTDLTPVRVATMNDGTNQAMYKNGAVVFGPSVVTHADSPWISATGLGYAPAFPAQLDGIISRVCLDPDPSRCR